jgi:hypothetical protein
MLGFRVALCFIDDTDVGTVQTYVTSISEVTEGEKEMHGKQDDRKQE